jgi:hypothetical protein
MHNELGGGWGSSWEKEMTESRQEQRKSADARADAGVAEEQDWLSPFFFTYATSVLKGHECCIYVYLIAITHQLVLKCRLLEYLPTRY